MKRILGILILFASALPAVTVFRVDPTPVMTTAGTPPPGGFPALYAMAGATISLCSDAACSIPVLSYTDATGNTTCPINAPVTLPGTAVCTPYAGAQGQFGFWLSLANSATTYYYTVNTSKGRFGPFPVSVAQTPQTIPSGGQNQFLRVQPNTGNLTTYQFAAMPFVNPSDYVFTISPAASLTAGVNATITLPYSPLGVAWNDTSHYVRIVDGVAGNDNHVLILFTGPGTCTSGALTACTVTLQGATISVNHTSGNWQMQSSSFGLDESARAAGAGGAHLLLSALSASTVYNPVVFSNPIWLDGSNPHETILTADSSMTTQNLLSFTGTIGKVTNIQINYPSGFNPSAGSALWSSSTDFFVTNIIIANTDQYSANDGVVCFGVPNCQVTDNQIYGTKRYGVYADNSSNAIIAFIWAENNSIICGQPNQCTAGIAVRDSIESSRIVGNLTEQGGVGILALSDLANSMIADNIIAQNIVDNANSAGIYFHCTFAAATCGFDRNQVLGNQIATAGSVSASGIVIDPGATGTASNFTISENSPITYSGSQSGILMRGVKGAIVSNNAISSADNTAGTGINLSTYASSNVSILGNDFRPFVSVGSTCSFQSIFADSSAHAGVLIGGGNSLCGSGGSGAIVDSNVTGGLTATADNLFLNGYPTIASAGTLALGPYPVAFISGNTAVTAFSQLVSGQSRNLTLIFTHATPGAVTACRSGSFAPVQYVPVSVAWDGSNAYCK